MAVDDYGVEVRFPVRSWEAEAAWNASLGRRIRSIASRQRVPLTEVSRRAQIPYTTLWSYVVEGRKMPAYAAVKVALALDVPISDFLYLA